MLKQKYNNDIPKMKDGLEVIFKQNDTKDDQAEVMRSEFNKYFKITENDSKSNKKSKEASLVLKLMDKDYSYKDALNAVVKSKKVNKRTLEKELDNYI